MTGYNVDQMLEGEKGWLFYDAAWKCWREIYEHIIGCSVLDIGCGSGIALSLIGVFRPDLKLMGLEEVESPLHIARGLNVATGNIYELPFPDDAFDTVFTSHVLEHTVDPAWALRESVRVARHRIIHVVPDGDVQGKNFGTRHRHTFNRINYSKLLQKYNVVTYKSITDNHMNSLLAVIDK